MKTGNLPNACQSIFVWVQQIPHGMKASQAGPTEVAAPAVVVEGVEDVPSGEINPKVDTAVVEGEAATVAG